MSSLPIKSHSFGPEVLELAYQAEAREDYLSAMIIYFVATEALLKVHLWGLAKLAGIREETIQASINSETSFRRLITVLELLDNDHELVLDLQTANEERNAIVHRIFSPEFTSFRELTSRMQVNATKLKSIRRRILSDKFGISPSPEEVGAS